MEKVLTLKPQKISSTSRKQEIDFLDTEQDVEEEKNETEQFHQISFLERQVDAWVYISS